MDPIQISKKDVERVAKTALLNILDLQVWGGDNGWGFARYCGWEKQDATRSYVPVDVVCSRYALNWVMENRNSDSSKRLLGVDSSMTAPAEIVVKMINVMESRLHNAIIKAVCAEELLLYGDDMRPLDISTAIVETPKQRRARLLQQYEDESAIRTHGAYEKVRAAEQERTGKKQDASNIRAAIKKGATERKESARAESTANNPFAVSRK